MCGIFSILHPNKDINIAKKLFIGLYTQQHRGQESCGITTMKNNQFYTHKDMGLVSQVFNDNNIAKLLGNIGIGHVRYSTEGLSNIIETQPIYIYTPFGPINLVFNGSLVHLNHTNKNF